MGRPRTPLAERLYPRLERTDTGCHEWTGWRDSKGYGQIRCSDRGKMGTHRAAWILEHGEIPEGYFVCHKCDNPPCCNVDHLFLGTPADNMQDMKMKGRSNTSRGTTRADCRLTDDDVREIRRRHRRYAYPISNTGCSTQELSREYGVSKGHIGDIVARRERAHVSD